MVGEIVGIYDHEGIEQFGIEDNRMAICRE